MEIKFSTHPEAPSFFYDSKRFPEIFSFKEFQRKKFRLFADYGNGSEWPTFGRQKFSLRLRTNSALKNPDSASDCVFLLAFMYLFHGNYTSQLAWREVLKTDNVHS